MNFLKKTNECCPSIKFEYEMSKSQINFLDTTVFKLDKKLRAKVYVKPTDRKSICTANQNILIPLKKGLPIVRHYGSIKFATIEAIFITTINDYLTC